MTAYSVEDCERTAEVLRQAVAALPRSQRAVRTTLARLAHEHELAVKEWQHAIDDGYEVEIVPVGGLASGEAIMLPAGRAEVRRISETGVETNVDGFWGWTNISSRTTPVAVVSA
jgi:hypothetical protein